MTSSKWGVLMPDGAGKAGQIMPTSKCFDDAMEFLERRIYGDVDTARHLILVHAICLMPVDQANAGERFVHAWVEDGDWCWCAGILNGEPIIFAMTHADHYERLRPQEVTRYTLADIYIENQRSRNYGPWKAEYLALCKESKCQTTSPSSEADSSPISSSKPSRE